VDVIRQGGLMLLGTYTTIFETPLGAFTTLFPLSIVLTISMIQEALSDYKRHCSDDEVRRQLLLYIPTTPFKRSGVLVNCMADK